MRLFFALLKTESRTLHTHARQIFYHWATSPSLSEVSFFFFDTESNYIAQAGLELLGSSNSFLSRWNYRCMTPHLAHEASFKQSYPDCKQVVTSCFIAMVPKSWGLQCSHFVSGPLSLSQSPHCCKTLMHTVAYIIYVYISVNTYLLGYIL
jgi:hypothetical protein